MNEIELNYKVADLTGILDFLRTFSPERILNMKMTYFGPEESDYADESTGFYARVEEIEENGRESAVLTAKGNFVREGNLKKCKEISIKVDDAEKSKELLRLLQIGSKDIKTKIRHLFNIDNMIVTVDEWSVNEMGNGIDIEGENEEELRKFAEKIMHFCEK